MSFAVLLSLCHATNLRPLTHFGYGAENYLLVESNRSAQEVEDFMSALDGSVDWNAVYDQVFGCNSHVTPSGTLATYAVIRNKPLVLEALRRRGANFNIQGRWAAMPSTPLSMAVALDPAYRFAAADQSAEDDACIRILLDGGADGFDGSVRSIMELCRRHHPTDTEREARYRHVHDVCGPLRDWPSTLYWTARVLASRGIPAEDIVRTSALPTDILPTVPSIYQTRFNETQGRLALEARGRDDTVTNPGTATRQSDAVVLGKAGKPISFDRVRRMWAAKKAKKTRREAIKTTLKRSRKAKKAKQAAQ